MTSTPKTARSRRTLKLSSPAVALLRSHRAEQGRERLAAGSVWQGSGYVFATEDGAPTDPRNLLRSFTTAARKAGLSGVGIHVLRHSAAATMLESGINIRAVADALGHSSISITGDLYGHTSDGAAQAAADMIASAYGL